MKSRLYATPHSTSNQPIQNRFCRSLVDLRIRQVEDVDDRVLLHDEMGEKEKCDQNEESCQTSKDENETFSPEK